MEAASHGRGGGGLDFLFLGENGEKKAEMTKKSMSAPMVFRTTAGESRIPGPTSRSDDHETKCSLALERCLHLDLILILSKVSSTTKKIQSQLVPDRGP